MDAKKLTVALILALLIVLALVSRERSPASSPPNTPALPLVPSVATVVNNTTLVNNPTVNNTTTVGYAAAPEANDQLPSSSNSTAPPIVPSADTVAATTTIVFAAAPEANSQLVPLALILPKLAYIGTPADMQLDEHIEPPTETKRPPLLMVPPGTVNLALRKTVTCSDKNPTAGAPELVTDGDKEATDEGFLQMRRGLQWVQIDLAQPATIYYILVWHAHNAAQIYKSVVVQIADDADFTLNVRTVFNNDYENKAGLGIGKDKQYFETFEGRWIPVRAEKARYVRSYSMGSTYSALNRITEIEVYGIPVP